MARSSTAAVLLVCVLAATFSGCSSTGDHNVGSASPTSTSAPAPEWLGVISSAADPNDLDAARAELADVLGQEGAAHVVLSPGGCFTGVPRRYRALYVLAVWDGTRGQLESRLRDSRTDPDWIGRVTSTCLD